jgi:hypothetical protein
MNTNPFKQKKLYLFDRVFPKISAVCDLPIALSELWLPSAITTLHYFTIEQLLFRIKWFFCMTSMANGDQRLRATLKGM